MLIDLPKALIEESQNRLEAFQTAVELLGASIKSGRQGGVDNSDPLGANLILSLQQNDELEYVVRFSFLDGDHRGIRVSDAIRRAEDPESDPAYDIVIAGYIGVNWYIDGDDIKLSAGYEYADFDQRLDGSGKDLNGGDPTVVQGLRAALQMQF